MHNVLFGQSSINILEPSLLLELSKYSISWNLLCVLSRLNACLLDLSFAVSFDTIILLVILLMLWYMLLTGCWPYRWHKGDRYLVSFVTLLLNILEPFQFFQVIIITSLQVCRSDEVGLIHSQSVIVLDSSVFVLFTVNVNLIRKLQKWIYYGDCICLLAF